MTIIEQIIHFHYKRLKLFNRKKDYVIVMKCKILCGKLTLLFLEGVFGRGLIMSSKENIKRDFTKQHRLSLKSSQYKLFNKVAVATMLFSTVSFNLAFANDNDSLEKIYHVYVGDTYIGAVSNEESVQKMIRTKEQEAKELYKDRVLEISSNVTLVPEQVFSYETEDSTTLSKLKDEQIVEAESYALKVNGQPVVYLKDQADYEKTLRLLKLQYVTEEQLKQYEENASLDTLPELKQNETRIKEITITEKLSGEETAVNPAEILTPEKAVQYLKTGSKVKEVYKVQEGDVLGTIASKHNLTTAQLLELNPGLTEDVLLQIGQGINVTVEKPLVNVQITIEKLNVEEIPFKEVVEEDESKFKGETEVKQEGKNGEKEVSYQIKHLNGKVTEETVTKETVLSEPVESITIKGTKVVSSRGTGEFKWPAVGGYISSKMGSRWGSYHRGIDIARPSNYNILASDNGVVTFTGWDGTYGQKIVISHNNGYETIYAHLSEIKVSEGQVVPQGSVIGIMGSTGRSTGTHLHFEVHKGGSLVNPLDYLN